MLYKLEILSDKSKWRRQVFGSTTTQWGQCLFKKLHSNSLFYKLFLRLGRLNSQKQAIVLLYNNKTFQNAFVFKAATITRQTGRSFAKSILMIACFQARTTDAQRGNILHCTAENSLPLPNFQVRPKHILSATSAQFF